ncbi:MAG TPA: glycoside hydrolase family 18 protein [Rhodanobacteraceae bacterium]|nr:glycoside hydrolase family 18 protein [Rhodanobacteraceae bacterium]
MRALKRVVLLCVGVVSASCAVAVKAVDTIFTDGFDAARWVEGYYVGYESDLYPIGEVDFSAVTHLMVGRARPLADGSVTTDFDIDDVNGPIWAQAAVDAAHAAGRKAVLMVGGAGEIDGWRGAASNANRAGFVANLFAVVDEFGFDGLDLDWEPLEGTDEPDFQALAQALRTQRPGTILTVPVAWINSNFSDPPDPWWGQIAPLFDRINIMTYDMAGAWDGWQSWHNSALQGETPTTPSSVSSSVLFYLASGVPAPTLGVGTAFYGYCWQGVTGPHQDGGAISAGDGTMTFANIIENYYTPTVRVWDTTALVPYLSSAAPLGAAGCNFVSYEDEQSIAQKGALVHAEGLGGTIIWTISQGHLADQPPGQRDPLLDAIRAAFLQ